MVKDQCDLVASLCHQLNIDIHSSSYKFLNIPKFSIFLDIPLGAFFLSFQETLPNNYVIPGDNIPGRSEDVCALRESHQQCMKADNV